MEIEDKKIGHKGLVVVLIILIAMIVCLAIGVITNINGNRTDYEDIAGDAAQVLGQSTEEEMVGWDGLVGSSARAQAFYDDINERVNSDPDYNMEEAISDWEEVYNSSSGDLRFFLAIRYADFIYEQERDLETAVGIMKRVEDLGMKPGNINYYYTTLYTLYEKAENKNKADLYRRLLVEIQTNEEG